MASVKLTSDVILQPVPITTTPLALAQEPHLKGVSFQYGAIYGGPYTKAVLSHIMSTTTWQAIESSDDFKLGKIHPVLDVSTTLAHSGNHASSQWTTHWDENDPVQKHFLFTTSDQAEMTNGMRGVQQIMYISNDVIVQHDTSLHMDMNLYINDRMVNRPFKITIQPDRWVAIFDQNTIYKYNGAYTNGLIYRLHLKYSKQQPIDPERTNQS